MFSAGTASFTTRESAGESRCQGVHQHRPRRPRDVPRQVGRAAASFRQKTTPADAAGRQRGAATDSTQQAGGATQEQGPRDQQDFEQAPGTAATSEDLNTRAPTLLMLGQGLLENGSRTLQCVLNCKFTVVVSNLSISMCNVKSVILVTLQDVIWGNYFNGADVTRSKEDTEGLGII
jgi:hypothetical protein